MSPTPIRASLEAGEAVVGARCVSRAPLFVEVLGGLGFDFVWIDFEHGGPSAMDATRLEHLTRAADAAGTDLLVRVPGADPHVIRKVLDTGVRSVLVPRVEGAGAVHRAVAASRFVHDGGPGERGMASGRANAWGADSEGYAEREDAEVTVGVMIENRSAVEAIDDILAVPDLGFCFVGPADLSVSLGHPQERDHPDVQAAIETVREACLEANVPVGRIRNDAAAAREAIAAGDRLVRVGSDVGATRAVLGDRLDGIRGG